MGATSKPRAWLTLDDIPSGRLERGISLPDDENWLAQFYGAFLLLTEEVNYEQFGDLTPEQNALEWRRVFFDFLGGLPMLLPVGLVSPFAGLVVPSGWLRCNGQEVSRSVYSDLFAAVSTTYGVGDGSTTFNVPDLTGRVAVMRDAMDTDINSLGETTGAKTHTLTIAQIPSHTHTQNSHNHSGTVMNAHYNVAPAGAQSKQGIQFRTDWNTGSPFITDGSTPTNQNTGGGGSHSSMQPSFVLDYIIKY